MKKLLFLFFCFLFLSPAFPNCEPEANQKNDMEILVNAFLKESENQADSAIICLRDIFIGCMTPATGIPGECPVGALDGYFGSNDCWYLNYTVIDAADPYFGPVKEFFEKFLDYALEQIKEELSITTKEQLKNRSNRLDEYEKNRLIKKFEDAQMTDFMKDNAEIIKKITENLKTGGKPLKEPVRFRITP